MPLVDIEFVIQNDQKNWRVMKYNASIMAKTTLCQYVVKYTDGVPCVGAFFVVESKQFSSGTFEMQKANASTGRPVQMTERVY